MTAATTLSFSRETFAKLAPARFLQAHLSEQPSKRANGRQQDEFRVPVINTGSLAHSNGSAVIRLGDTAVVCGVRGEILLASDVPNPPREHEQDHIEELGLLVPNLELSTGCSKAHLPGNPPSSLAQGLSWRLHTLLHSSGLLRLDDLRVKYTAPQIESDDDDALPEPATKAYWTLYLDILCISLDGACLDAAWLAIVAALRTTRLPQAYWDPEREAIFCSPDASKSSLLSISNISIACTFAIFSTASPMKPQIEAEHWILADSDSFEEETCQACVTITTGNKGVFRIEKSGGQAISSDNIKHCIELAKRRLQQVQASLTGD